MTVAEVRKRKKNHSTGYADYKYKHRNESTLEATFCATPHTHVKTYTHIFIVA